MGTCMQERPKGRQASRSFYEVATIGSDLMENGHWNAAMNLK
jgi:hypothetical protein